MTKRHGFRSGSDKISGKVTIEGYIQALEIAKAYAEIRKKYNGLLVIAEEEFVNEDLKYEAQELTKNGFEGYLKHMNEIVRRDN